MEYYLAIDIGASGGRHIIGWLEDNKLQLKEIHRFRNGLEEKNGHLCWNLDALKQEIVAGMKKCADVGMIPCSMGIDTWGVDFVLLDEADRPIGDAVGYRDSRTDGMIAQIQNKISSDELYQRTGIQEAVFNTLCQLEAIRTTSPEMLEKAKNLLFLPDYFNFLLTGKKMCEYTIASTSQMLDVKSGDWDFDLIRKMGYPENIFLPITKPGTPVGNLSDEVKKEVGFDTQVMLVGSHDTASAVASVPFQNDSSLYISSGTWSLLGIESNIPNTDLAARDAGFTNEGGYGNKIRFLKNIMGMWMIQSVRRELGEVHSYPELADMAEQNRNFPSRVNVNDHSFLAPKSMIQAIQNYCKNSDQKIPQTPGELAMVIFGSLSESYAESIRELENIVGKKFSAIHIVGGGCNNRFLNRLTEETTKLPVLTGPSEGTAVGNLVVQMLSTAAFSNLTEARKIIANSAL